MIKKIFNGLAAVSTPIIDFVLPPICLNCEEPLKKEEKYLCGKCTETIVKIDNSTGTIINHINVDGYITKAFSFYLFREGTAIQKLIHYLKYGQMRYIGKYYGSLFAGSELVKENLNADYIIPVPLHLSKKRERGYNQSEYICEGIGEVLKIKALPKCLKRKRYTRTQTKLSREERIKNLSGAFEVREQSREMINKKNIILTDDVITTGSTISECARVLKNAGCGEIFVCSLGFAEL